MAEKSNVKLKTAAYISIGTAFLLSIVMMLMLATMEKVSHTVVLWLRGLTGLFTTIFVVLIAILIYRVNVSYFKYKTDSKRP